MIITHSVRLPRTWSKINRLPAHRESLTATVTRSQFSPNSTWQPHRVSKCTCAAYRPLHLYYTPRRSLLTRREPLQKQLTSIASFQHFWSLSESEQRESWGFGDVSSRRDWLIEEKQYDINKRVGNTVSKRLSTLHFCFVCVQFKSLHRDDSHMMGHGDKVWTATTLPTNKQPSQTPHIHINKEPGRVI